jgi:hypothetical protein
MIHRAGRSSTQSRRCLKLPYQIMAPLGLPCPCRCCSELPISCRLGGIYIFAIITVGTSSKAILRINLTVLPFLYENQFKIAIFTDVARHGSIGCMPREHHRAKFRPCPCLQLPSSTDMCDPHVSVVFNLKTKADACRSATIPSPVPGAPSPGPTRPLPVVAVALAPSGRQSSSTASKIRTTSNAVPRRHPTWRAGSGGASSPRHQRRALPLDRRPTPLPLDGHGQRPPGQSHTGRRSSRSVSPPRGWAAAAASPWPARPPSGRHAASPWPASLPVAGSSPPCDHLISRGWAIAAPWPTAAASSRSAPSLERGMPPWQGQ